MTPQRNLENTPKRRYRRFSRPKSFFNDSDDSMNDSLQDFLDNPKLLNRNPIEICSSPEPEVQVNSAPTTPKKTVKEKAVKSLQQRSVSYTPTTPKVMKQKESPKKKQATITTPINLADFGLAEDDTLKKMEKNQLIEKCTPYGIKKTLGKRAMMSKLNEIYSE